MVRIGFMDDILCRRTMRVFVGDAVGIFVGRAGQGEEGREYVGERRKEARAVPVGGKRQGASLRVTLVVCHPHL
jgi:hypothetical protein